jgi:hypothetical protein
MFKFEKENGEEKLCFDFSSVIPMPPELDIECDGWIGEVESKRLSNHTMIKDLLDRLRSHIASHSEDVKKQTIKNFVQGIENYLTHGYLSFYDWRRAHWGTKWNSYSLDDRNFPEFTFETAWAFPIPVFEKLAKEFPALKFDLKTFDEGWMFAGEGYFYGDDVTFQIGKATKELYKDVYGEEYEEEVEEEA